jgi:hypothetical protein
VKPPQLIADDWMQPTYDSVANYTFQPAQPSRNDTVDGIFDTFRLGVYPALHCHRSEFVLKLCAGRRRLRTSIHSTSFLLVQQRQ